MPAKKVTRAQDSAAASDGTPTPVITSAVADAASSAPQTPSTAANNKSGDSGGSEPFKAVLIKAVSFNKDARTAIVCTIAAWDPAKSKRQDPRDVTITNVTGPEDLEHLPCAALIQSVKNNTYRMAALSVPDDDDDDYEDDVDTGGDEGTRGRRRRRRGFTFTSARTPADVCMWIGKQDTDSILHVAFPLTATLDSASISKHSMEYRLVLPPLGNAAPGGGHRMRAFAPVEGTFKDTTHKDTGATYFVHNGADDLVGLLTGDDAAAVGAGGRVRLPTSAGANEVVFPAPLVLRWTSTDQPHKDPVPQNVNTKGMPLAVAPHKLREALAANPSVAPPSTLLRFYHNPANGAPAVPPVSVSLVWRLKAKDYVDAATLITDSGDVYGYGGSLSILIKPSKKFVSLDVASTDADVSEAHVKLFNATIVAVKDHLRDTYKAENTKYPVRNLAREVRLADVLLGTGIRHDVAPAAGVDDSDDDLAGAFGNSAAVNQSQARVLTKKTPRAHVSIMPACDMDGFLQHLPAIKFVAASGNLHVLPDDTYINMVHPLLNGIGDAHGAYVVRTVTAGALRSHFEQVDEKRRADAAAATDGDDAAAQKADGGPPFDPTGLLAHAKTLVTSPATRSLLDALCELCLFRYILVYGIAVKANFVALGLRPPAT